MTDPFDDFQREMLKRTRQSARSHQNEASARVQQQQAARDPPKFTEQEKRDRAVIAAMASMRLKPGQMLLLGPRSIAVLSGLIPYEGALPDKFILERSDWAT